MDWLWAWGIAAGTAAAYMTIVWIISLPLRNASIVDIAWGPGFAAVALAVAALRRNLSIVDVGVMILVGVWALRLAIHVLVRNRGKGEDWRYRAWRDEAGGSFWWVSYFRVFLLQGIVMTLVSLPLAILLGSLLPERIGVLAWVGGAVCGFGILFEAVADLQLARFKKQAENKGKVMDRGLWRYSRHPNYFGESLVWWGFFLMALSVDKGYVGLVSPLLMTFLLVRVSGVRMLEKGMRKRKPEYEDYIRRTSPFIPLPPKKPASRK